MSVVGFDLGNYTSYIAIARQGGIEVLTNDYSLHATPSCVAFGPQSRVMGVAARQKVNTNVKNTVICFKQLIGRKFSDPVSQRFMEWVPCSTVQLPDDNIGLKVQYRGETRVFTPEQVAAMLLVKLKEITQAGVKELARVTDCVVSVPFYFTDVQRQALLSAIKLAGLNSLRIVNETTAIALAYGIYKHDLPDSKSAPKHVVFVDVGHSACQAALVALHRDQLVVLNQAYDFGCSGLLFDGAICEHFRKVFIDEKKIDAKSTPRSWLRLLDECEKLKKMMSANTNPLQLNVECLMNDVDVSGKMQRTEFEELITPYLARLRNMLIGLLASAGLKVEDIDEVEIVGGSSRVPAVKRVIAEVFKRDPKTTMNQDEAVSRGAAMMCAIMSPVFRVKEFSVRDSFPFQVKLSWEEGGLLHVVSCFRSNNIFNERDEFPFSKMITLYRAKPFQLHAEYSSIEIPHSIRQIGTWNIKNPSTYNWDGTKRIKIKVRVNRDGIFSLCSAAAYDEVEIKEPEVAAGEPMDTDGTKEDTAAPSPTSPDGTDKKAVAESDTNTSSPKPKTKTISTDFIVEENKVMWINNFDELQRAENEMQDNDRKEKEKADAKNCLEEYIYYIRDKLSGPFAPFILESDTNVFQNKLNDMENWLYEDGENAEKKDYEEKLAELKVLGDPVQERWREHEKRGEAFDNFDRVLLRTKKAYDEYCKGHPQYSHLDSKEMEKVINACEEKKKWLDEQRGKQERRPLTDPPVIFVHQIAEELRAFESIVTPILNKPPPPKEEKKEKPSAKKDEKNDKEATGDNATAPSHKGNAPQPSADAAEMEVD
uniref:Heat shock 70 kDa protein 4L n=1 Tax=Syphacia muris TaxID=451379 RepID=A0A0N5AXQ3_9BILA